MQDNTLYGKKKKKLPKCPNPLFLAWLREWYEDAAEKNAKSQYTYKKALNTLMRFPLPLNTGKDCKILENFGDKICKMLDDRLQKHIRENGTDQLVCTVDEEEKPAVKKDVKNEKKRENKGEVTKVRRAPAAVHELSDSDSDEHSEPRPPARKRQKSGSGGEREYIPQLRSGPYALLLALYKHMQDPDSVGYLSKNDLIEKAQPLADKSFTLPDPGSRYTAWSSMGTLIKKGYVIKDSSPARYSLTDKGCELAHKLEAVEVDCNNDSIPFRINEPGLACPLPQQSPPNDRLPSMHCSDDEEDLGIDIAYRNSRVGSGLKYWYITADDREVIHKDQAMVTVEDDIGVGFLVKCNYTAVLRARVKYKLDMSRPHRDDFCYLYLSNDDASEIATPPYSHYSQPTDTGPKTTAVEKDNTIGNAKPKPQKKKDVKSIKTDGLSLLPLVTNKDKISPTTEQDHKHSRDIVLIDDENRCTSSLKNIEPSVFSDKITVPNTENKTRVTPYLNDVNRTSVPALNEDLSQESSQCSIKSITDSSQSSVSSNLPEPDFILLPGQFDIVLCVDNAEFYGQSKGSSKTLLPDLMKNGIQCDLRKLHVGDLLWIAKERVRPVPGRLETPKGRELVLNYIIERKRMDDLVSSCIDGRFKEQKFRLKKCGLKHLIYLIEDHGSLQHFSIPEATIRQTITNTQGLIPFKVEVRSHVNETGFESPKVNMESELKSEDKNISAECPICNVNLQYGKAVVQIRSKGSDSVNKASKLRKDTVLTHPGQRVHVECRKSYCNPSNIQKALIVKKPEQVQSPSLRSYTGSFNFDTHCLFCGKNAKCLGRKRGNEVFQVRTLSFQENIKTICRSRNDEWASEVEGRLQNINDLPAADAIYHQSCSVNFRTGKQIPNSIESCSERKRRKCGSGRPINIFQESAFKDIVQYLEVNSNEQVTIKDLVMKMTDLCGELAYTTTHLKNRLLQHFGSSIVITDINGKQNVVTFKSTASAILQAFHQRTKSLDANDEKIEIAKTAARLILNDIKNLPSSKTIYPPAGVVSSVEENIDFLPDTLKFFLKELCIEKNAGIKVAAIGQSIMQAARPKSIIAPLQIGLGIQMHHHFASKFLIETLNKLGFSLSYKEIQKFEASAAFSQGIDLPLLENGQFCQFVGDNVDHNLRTLDSHNTFHGMGITACYTPKLKHGNAIQRVSVSTEELSNLGKIDIKFYKQEHAFMQELKFEKLPDTIYDDSTEHLDLLSKYVWPLKQKKPGWSGFMQAVQKGNHHGISSVCFLPIIDMEASDLSCIYSTLMFVCKQGSRLNITPVITFDQPLFWKAMTIVCNEPAMSRLKSIVLRLGGFHTIMSFLGCIGRLMDGSGLSNLFETVYAKNAVVHMMSGKAVSRAVRAHLLAEEVLHSILVSKACNLEFSRSLYVKSRDTYELENGRDSSNYDENANDNKSLVTVKTDEQKLLEVIAKQHTDLLAGSLEIEDVNKDEALVKIMEKIDILKGNLIQYRTAKSWLMYLTMINILCLFIKAERTGSWRLHLHAVRQMLPYLAAAGHNLYVKSAYLYLQTMSTLEKDHPEVFANFLAGNHVVRRSDRFWAGLSSDLIIEQVLMRSVKTTGGLTRGRGLSDAQRNQWLLSMPACTEYNNAMQEFSGVSYHTSEQHTECSIARMERDEDDKVKFLQFLVERDPFEELESLLRNIETGETADVDVNVDDSKSIGNKVLKSMASENVLQFSFKRSCQALTLNSKSSVTINKETVTIDPQLLFQRLATAADRLYDNQTEVFKYELCSYPSSLFESVGVLCPADKPALANAIWSLGKCEITELIDVSVKYVIDGGSLLQRIPWKQGDTFGKICRSYVSYVESHYKSSKVVFDGYKLGPSTKDGAHQKRSKGRTSTLVQFSDNTPFRSKKENFLSNVQNKQSFIDMLSKYLQDNGFDTLHASEDADLLIVLTAVELAKSSVTVVVGEDTDLLVLLCYHADVLANKLFFLPGRNLKNSKSLKEWDIVSTKRTLGTTICNCLPLIHALSGCDTTSRVYGLGKAAVLKRFCNSPSLQNLASVFLKNDSEKLEIIQAGEEILVDLYKGDANESLNQLRFRKFVSKVMTSLNYVQVHTLPPTSASAYYHTLRVYLQVQRWLGPDITLDPLDWGWKSENGSYRAMQTNLPPAPEDLLEVIRCACKINCDTKRCTCRRYGLDCSSGCGECRGTSCSNAIVLTDHDIDEYLEVKRTKDSKETVAFLTVFTRYLQSCYRDKTLYAASLESIKEANIPYSVDDIQQRLPIFEEFNQGSVKTKALTVREMFGKQLIQIYGMSAEKALAVTDKYPTPSVLLRAYQCCTTEKEKENLLSGIKCGKSNRSLGSAQSKQIYQLYNTSTALQ